MIVDVGAMAYQMVEPYARIEFLLSVQLYALVVLLSAGVSYWFRPDNVWSVLKIHLGGLPMGSLALGLFYYLHLVVEQHLGQHICWYSCGRYGFIWQTAFLATAFHLQLPMTMLLTEYLNVKGQRAATAHMLASRAHLIPLIHPSSAPYSIPALAPLALTGLGPAPAPGTTDSSDSGG